MKLPRRKHLVILDFDETLCQTNGVIRVRNVETDDTWDITPAEYVLWYESEYQNQPSKFDLDFSEFQGFPEKGKPIEQTMNILRKYINDDVYVTCIVTGRDELSGPIQFLRGWGVPIEQMVFMCSGNPDKKSCYESLFNTFYPNSVTIYEDCKTHIHQCEVVCAKYKIPCASVLIEDGQINWSWKITQREYYE